MTHVVTFSKKAFTWAVVAATILWSVGIFGVLSVAQATSVSSGDLIKASGAAVYYLGSDNKRYVFPNEKTYKTWFSDFSTVKTITDAELASYMIGGNVTYRPGVKMVKITTDPKVYAVGMNGELRWVESEAVASALYGANWNTMIEDVPDAFFVNYMVGSSISNATQFNVSGVTAASSTINVDKGLSAESVGGGLTITLAPSTPASGLVVGNAARVPFTRVNLTASSDADVTVNSLTVLRGGPSSDSNFAGVVLLNGDTSLQIGNYKTLNSNHQAVFDNDFIVKAGTTLPLVIAGNMNPVATYNGGGEVITLGLVSIDTNGTVTGSLPVTGNAMTKNGTLAIGSLTIANGGLNPADQTKNIGTDNYIFSSIKMTAGSAEDMHITHVIWDQNGTSADADVANLELVVDGAVVASVANPSDKKVNFDLSVTPIVIAKGNNKEASIRGDILSGSARTIDFDIRKNTDVVAEGQTFGYNVTPTFPNSSEPYFSGNITTIAGGTLTVGKANLVSKNVAEGADQQELGTFTLQVEGEPVDITSLKMTNSSTTAGVTNMTVYNPNGDVVAGPTEPAAGVTTFTDTITVPVGISTYTVKGDLDSAFTAGDTMKLTLNVSTWVARGSETNNTLTAGTDLTPDGDVALDTLTVKVGALSITNRNTPAAQNVLVGQQDFEFLSFTIDATASGEDVRLQQLIFNMNGTGTEADITGITVLDGATALNVPDNGASSVTVDLVNPLIITKGTSKTLSLQADITGTGTAGDTYRFTTSDSTTPTGVSTGNTITETVTGDGQVMTIIANGGLEVATDAANPQSTLFAVGDTTGATGVTIGEVRMMATTGEDILLDSVNLTTTGSDINSTVGTVYLYDGATKVAEATPTTTAAVYLDVVDNVIIPKGAKGKKFTVKADFLAISDSSPSASGNSVAVNVAAGNALGKGSASNAVIASLGSMAGYTHYAFGSVPTVAPGALSSNVLTPGTLELYRFTVSADAAGDIGLGNFTFNVATSGVTVTNFYVTDETDDTQLNDTVVTTQSPTIEITFNPGGGGIVERQISAGTTHTYVLKGTVTGSSSSDSVQVSLAGDSAALSATTETLADARADAQDDFIWTDRTATSHAITTTDWISGFRVKGLPSSNTSPEVLSKA